MIVVLTSTLEQRPLACSDLLLLAVGKPGIPVHSVVAEPERVSKEVYDMVTYTPFVISFTEICEVSTYVFYLVTYISKRIADTA